MFKSGIRNAFKLSLFFLIWPIGALILALRNLHRSSSFFIVYLFILYFGFTFVLGNDKLDSYRYAEYFESMSKYSISDLALLFSGFFTTEKLLDFAQPSISFFVSRLTSDHRAFFGVIAAIFGFFYIKSVKILYDSYYYSNRNRLSLLLLLFFALIVNPVFNINGFRFWTATWIYFYCVYYYFTTNNRKYFFLIFLSVFFHFSFFAPVCVFFCFLFFGIRNNLYFMLLICSFFLSDFVFQVIPEVTDFLGDGVATKADRYANVTTMENVSERTAVAIDEGKWYIYLPQKLTFYYVAILFLFVGNKFRTISSDVALMKIFSFSLLFLSFANTVAFVPSLGRFRTVFLLFALSYLILVLKYITNRKFSFYVYLGVIPFLLNLIIVVRLGMDIVNPWIFTFLPVPYMFPVQSIYQFIF